MVWWQRKDLGLLESVETSRDLGEEGNPALPLQMPKAEEAGEAIPLQPKARGLRRLSTCVIRSRASVPGRSAVSRGVDVTRGLQAGRRGSLPVAPEMGIEQANGHRRDRPHFAFVLSSPPSLSELLGCSTILGASPLQRSPREARAPGVTVCLGSYELSQSAFLAVRRPKMGRSFFFT